MLSRGTFATVTPAGARGAKSAASDPEAKLQVEGHGIDRRLRKSGLRSQSQVVRCLEWSLVTSIRVPFSSLGRRHCVRTAVENLFEEKINDNNPLWGDDYIQTAQVAFLVSCAKAPSFLHGWQMVEFKIPGWLHKWANMDVTPNDKIIVEFIEVGSWASGIRFSHT